MDAQRKQNLEKEADSREGVENSPKEPVRLNMNERAPDFSEEELEFFRRAIEHRHISQAHFADPGADYCYCCPKFRKVINGEGVLQRSRFTSGCSMGTPTRCFTS